MMAPSIAARSRRPRLPGLKTPLRIVKGPFREDAHGQELPRVLVAGNIDENETSVSKDCLQFWTNLSRMAGVEEHHLEAALTSSTVRIPIPGLIQLVENYAELYPGVTNCMPTLDISISWKPP